MRKIKVRFLVVLAVMLSVALALAAGQKIFKANLSGKEAVPAVKTKAGGEAIFELSKDGKELMYKLNVTNIADVTMAHIHEGSKGKNGSPVVNLFTGPGKEGSFTGTLAQGTITEKDLSGPLTGKSLHALIKMIHDGKAYVNVHTNQYPDGEIRGQIK